MIDRGKARRAKQPIALRHQLVVVLVVPALAVVALVAYFADLAAREALERAVAARLVTVAEAAAILVGPRVTLLERGDEGARTTKRSLSKLSELERSTGVARILFVRLRGSEVLLDTQGALSIGEEYTRARFDQPELERVARGESAASVLFEGSDGRPYKTGYAPLAEKSGEILAYVAVNAPADYAAAIDALRATVGGIAVLGVALLLVGAAWAARRVSVPLSRLSEAAERIGAGELGADIPRGGPREAVILADTMRSMSQSLKGREEEMQMMLAGIAHEVRNPLGGIELFGGLLREDLAGDPRQKHVDKILRELKVLAKVVNDFLDFARRRPPELSEVDLSDLLFEAVSVAEKEASDRGVSVSLSTEGRLLARLDPEAMRRALLNVVQNAVQAAPKQAGEVHVRAAADGAGVLEIEISDNGAGIPPDKREEIFAPFFTTKQKGTGLGLALVKKTVLEHGGSIAALERTGGGARFVIRVPAKPAP